MAVTVKTATLDRSPCWENYGDLHRLVFTVNLTMRMEMRDGSLRTVVVTMLPGFRCDGLSVPYVFRWFMKSWDDSNDLYNIAGALHDWLYATEGNRGMFSRSECDDIFRGILREAGKSRKTAGIADWAVGVFAGGSNHWGNDSECIKDLAWLTVRESAAS